MASANLAQLPAGEMAETLSVCKTILQSDPKHFDALMLAGTTSLRMGEARIAAGLLRQAVAVNGDHPELHYNLGSAYLSLDEHANAIAHLNQAIRLKPDYAEAHADLGKSLWAAGQFPAAYAALETAVALQPGATAPMATLARLLQRAGEHENAVDVLRKVLGLIGNHALAQAMLGLSLLEMNNLDEARRCFENARDLSPDLGKAYLGLASIARLQGHLIRGLILIDHAVELTPHDPEVHLARGDIWRDKRDIEKALDAYQISVDLAANLPAAHAGLCWALIGLDEPDKADYHARLAAELEQARRTAAA